MFNDVNRQDLQYNGSSQINTDARYLIKKSSSTKTFSIFPGNLIHREKPFILNFMTATNSVQLYIVRKRCETDMSSEWFESS